MAKIVTRDQRIVTAGKNPASVYSRLFALSCRATAGMGNSDLAYSPPLGGTFWLKFISLHYFGGLPADPCSGMIFMSFGTGIPNADMVTVRWEQLIPFWSGPIKPTFVVQGFDQYLSWPINRLFQREALRFGMWIGNGSDTRSFSVNAFFEISEG